MIAAGRRYLASMSTTSPVNVGDPGSGMPAIWLVNVRVLRPVLPLRHDGVERILANGGAAFFELRCYWLQGLRQRQIAVVRQGPASNQFLYLQNITFGTRVWKSVPLSVWYVISWRHSESHNYSSHSSVYLIVFSLEIVTLRTKLLCEEHCYKSY